MEILEQVVAEHPFFEGMSREHIEAVARCANRVRFDAGDRIFREGGEAVHVYLIQQGQVSLEIFDLQRGPLVIQSIGPGDVLGWSWLVPPYQWRFDAHATDPVAAIALDGRRLRTACDAAPALGYAVTKRFAMVLESRLQATRAQLMEARG